jgi:hypothetical protein
MKYPKPISWLGPVLFLGAAWGFCETAAGLGLRACASSVSGALLTGGAVFFIAAGWAATGRARGILLMAGLAAGFKLFDAWLLGFPLNHGAIGNPMFAIVMEALAFLIFAVVLKPSLAERGWGRALHGGLAALLAANLFPLVRFATGVPACTVAGTGYPLSLYYVHVAVLASMAAAPLGFRVGAWVRSLENRRFSREWPRGLKPWIPPAALALFLGLVALIRLG